MRPRIRVVSLGAEADDEIRRVNEFRLFQFTDPEGNVIEVYEATEQAS